MWLKIKQAAVRLLRQIIIVLSVWGWNMDENWWGQVITLQGHPTLATPASWTSMIAQRNNWSIRSVLGMKAGISTREMSFPTSACAAIALTAGDLLELDANLVANGRGAGPLAADMWMPRIETITGATADDLYPFDTDVMG